MDSSFGNKSNLVDARTLSKFFECDLKTIRRFERESNKTDYDFKCGGENMILYSP